MSGMVARRKITNQRFPSVPLFFVSESGRADKINRNGIDLSLKVGETPLKVKLVYKESVCFVILLLFYCVGFGIEIC